MPGMGSAGRNAPEEGKKHSEQGSEVRVFANHSVSPQSS